MKAVAFLHELISGLSSAEKRHVAGSFVRPEGKYARLYRAIASQTVYDEKALRQKFKGEAFLRQLPVAKSYLYDHILKVLRGFHRGRTATLELREMVDQIELLWHRNLHHQSQTILAKAKSKAMLLEVWTVGLECLELEMRLVRRSGKPEIRAQLDVLLSEQAKLVELIRREKELRKCYDLVFGLRRKGQSLRSREDRKLLKEVMGQRILRKKTPDSWRLAVLYHYIHLYAAQLKGDLNEVIRRYELLLGGWEKDPRVANHDQDRYLRALLSYLDILTGLPDTQRTAPVLQKVESLKLNLPSLKSLRTYYLFHLKIRYFGNEGKIEEGMEFVHARRSELNGILEMGSDAARLSLLNNLLVLHFLGKDFSSSLEFVEELLAEKNAGIRQDVQLFARLLLLPIHFELGNLDLMESLLRSAKRYFQRHQDLSEFEEDYFRFFKRLLMVHGGKEERKAFEDYLLTLKTAPKGILGLEELQVWIKEKVRIA